MAKSQRPLPWLDVDESFPPVDTAWGHADPAPGLLAAGAVLDVPTLVQAYSQGIFPWFSEGQPVLWWSPNPRMVLNTARFKLHRSLRKSLSHLLDAQRLEIRFDHGFERVIQACANKPRAGQPGTWIVPDMVKAYGNLHMAGHAHSIETWIDGELAGGLYCVNLGGMVFGESMFAHQTDASKLALCALVGFCRAHHITMIDCQQNTQHLASLGAAEISREDFCAHLDNTVGLAAPIWHFNPLYFHQILADRTITTP
jgi:leucyl/phenylalanyl-tRNA---protein transferase